MASWDSWEDDDVKDTWDMESENSDDDTPVPVQQPQSIGPTVSTSCHGDGRRILKEERSTVKDKEENQRIVHSLEGMTIKASKHELESQESESSDSEDDNIEDVPMVISNDEDDESSEDEDDTPLGRAQMQVYTQAKKACEELYIKAPRIDLNLMHDFTESDLFTIDGDSLLADIFAHKGLDFTHGGQLLHFVYLVEHFLQDFQDREGQYHIIFFTEAESMWHSNPLKLLARRTIIQHLMHNTKCHLITDISHPYSPKWKDYINKEHPAFIMLSDGESLKGRRNMVIKSLLRASVMSGLDCAFCSAMRRSLRSVNTFYIEARKANRFCGKAREDGYLNATSSLKRVNANIYTEHEIDRVCDQLKSIVAENEDSADLISTSRDIIIVIACAEVMKGAFASDEQDEMDRAFTAGAVQACILQSVLLEYLSLEARAQNIPDDSEFAPCVTDIMDSFLKRLHYSMARVLASYEDLHEKLCNLDGMRETSSLADLMDGRLIYAMSYLLQKQSQSGIQACFPSEVTKKLQYLWQLTVGLSVEDVSNENTNYLKAFQVGGDGPVMQTSSVQIYRNTSTQMEGCKSLSKQRKGLVHVEAQLVTDYAGGLLSELASHKTDNLKSISAKLKQFVENYHWHTGRPLKDDYDNTREDKIVLSKDKWRRKWQLQNNQKFAKYMQSYGESLEGRARGLRQQTIAVDKSRGAKSKKGSTKHQGQKQKQKVSGKDKILQEKLLKDQAAADESAAQKWSNIFDDIKSDIEARKFAAAVKTIDNFLGHCSSDKWTIEAMLAMMDCYWIALKYAKTTAIRSEVLHRPSSLFSDLTDAHPMYYPIMVFVCSQEVLKYEEMLTKKQLKFIRKHMSGLGFESLAQRIKAMEYGKPSGEDFLKPFSKKLPEPDECSIGMSCTRFQLQFVGQWMKRNERTDKDPRVPHFIPDTWQRELLDVVDRNESALIVAPTSSGKTYASYYCMEKILREGNDGVVVYVSPTKALMNQVSATIYARFNKTLPAGKVVCGAFSRDFRRNALNCQILVTVPQCLEILLLSPCRQEWSKRVRYVIFDEVHCLGGEIGAEVWEHLLVAINCPFLALSATVRNPEDIRGWLQASQDFKQQQNEEILRQSEAIPSSKKKSASGSAADKADDNAFKVGLVIWEERHSDLEKFMYLPNGKQKRNLLPDDDSLSQTEEFVPVHPVAMLDITKVKAKGLPSDLTLSPRETLVLYDAMKDAYPASEQIKELDPDVYFQDIPVLEKQDARNYERDLKTELMKWIEEEDQVDKVVKIISNLKANIMHVSNTNKPALWTDKAAVNGYAKLIRQLNKQNKLPAIAFSQNRNLCERLANTIASSLEMAEMDLRRRFEASAQCKEVLKIMDKLEKAAKRSKDKETDGEETRKPPKYTQGVPMQDDDRTDFRLQTKRRKPPSWQKPASHDKSPDQDAEKTEETRKPPKYTQGVPMQDDDRTDFRLQTKRRKPPSWQKPASHDKSPDQDAERFEACLSQANRWERAKLLDVKFLLMEDTLPSCTLQGEGNLTQEEIDEILERLPYDETSCNLRRLISRGVAYHHAGLNNKQRVAVETLFRMGHLKIVSATATLALGIHMPCKTVVFVCEDLWLKPLSFRQMAGRSGRRGFDLVGNVIFYCVPPQKVQHLVTSGLPHLRGHFPFSVTFVLRLMVLTHNSKDKRNAHEKALGLLKHPFVCHKSQGMEEVVKHFFLFSVDYLIRVGLLEPNGTPIGLSGLATHLHYHEPANLTFVSMLQEGVFHELCEPSRGRHFPTSVMETLVMVLAQMFGRVTMPMSAYKRKQKEGIHSKVVFGESLQMPHDFSKVLERHNKDAWKVFRRYVHTVCDYAARRDDAVQQNVLPLSKVAIQPNDTRLSVSEGALGEDNVLKRLISSANQSTTLSPFVMTSGHSDKDLPEFDADILQAIRQGVHIEQTKIPTLIPPSELRDTRGTPLYLNAYAYDFFKHGSAKVIRRENGLASGDVFDKLKDFKLVIAAISVALQELGPEDDNVVWAFRQLQGEYTDKFKLQYPSYRD